MRILVVCVLFFFCLAGCSQKAWIDRLASQEEQRLALETADALRQGNLNQIAKEAEPQFRTELPGAVGQVRPILARANGPFSIQTVNVVEEASGPTVKSFAVEAGSGSKWALAEIVFRGTPGAMQLAGFHVLPAASQPSKLNDFDIGQRGMLGYVWLLLMFTSAALCIVAVVLIWRRPWLSRRWLWTLGSILGFAGMGLNWSNGVWALLFVNISLLGATATRAGPFSPWHLTFGIPIVAIIVIVRWFRQVRPEQEA